MCSASGDRLPLVLPARAALPLVGGVSAEVAPSPAVDAEHGAVLGMRLVWAPPAHWAVHRAPHRLPARRFQSFAASCGVSLSKASTETSQSVQGHRTYQTCLPLSLDDTNSASRPQNGQGFSPISLILPTSLPAATSPRRTICGSCPCTRSIRAPSYRFGRFPCMGAIPTPWNPASRACRIGRTCTFSFFKCSHPRRLAYKHHCSAFRTVVEVADHSIVVVIVSVTAA